MSMLRNAAVAAVLTPLSLLAQFRAQPLGTGPIKVGPEHGTVIVVGGGAMGPEVYKAFIDAAGGPDALIIDVPNADGKDAYDQTSSTASGWKRAGAKTVYVLFTKDRKLADTDSFVAILKKAGGVWFDGGRQFHLVEDYAGTKTEAGFMDVLARGGVVGGSSAGASILGDFMVRGAPSSNNMIMDYNQEPKYEKGFYYLRNVGIDQHVVARERLADLADSIMPRYPNLLGISEDEGTAWVVKGDTAHIIGRDKAFVYGGKDATDAGKPFITLYPGDTYNMATRHVMHRAMQDSPVTVDFITPLFSKYENPTAGGATVLVARNGEVLVDRAFGIPAQPKYMPTTTVPLFAVGGLSDVFKSICDQLPAPAARGGRGAAAPDTTVSATAGRREGDRRHCRRRGGCGRGWSGGRARGTGRSGRNTQHAVPDLRE